MSTKDKSKKEESNKKESSKEESKNQNINNRFVVHNIKDIVNFFIKNTYKIPEDHKIDYIDYFIDTNKGKLVVQLMVSKVE